MIYKYHIVYRTVNKITNHYYYGIHSTNNLNDGYLGSGIYLKKAIKKYGTSNFNKEILEIYDNRDDAIKKEREIVNCELVKNKMCYNLHVGGESPQLRTVETREKISRTLKEYYKERKPPFYGKKHSEENKKKFSAIMKGKMAGEKNPMYGTNRPDHVKEKIRNKLIGRKVGDRLTEEGRKKLSITHKNKIVSSEAKQKMSNAKMGMYNGGDNPNSTKIIHFDTNKIFSCMKDACAENNISMYRLRKLINNGEYKVLHDTEHHIHVLNKFLK